MPNWLTFRPWQRHSLVLMISGFCYIMLGASYWFNYDMTQARQLALNVALGIMSIEAWSLLFMVTGVFACISSRWPTFSSNWGYMALTGMASAWSALYLLGFLFGPAPRSSINYSLIWALLAFMWWAISGLVNPERILLEVENGAN